MCTGENQVRETKGQLLSPCQLWFLSDAVSVSAALRLGLAFPHPPNLLNLTLNVQNFREHLA